MKKLLTFSMMSALLATPATPCEKIAPTNWLPGYSETEAWDRAKAIWKDWEVIDAYREEERLYESTPTIVLGRVITKNTSEADSRLPYARSVILEPLLAIRGEVPTEPIKLVTAMENSCGNPTVNGEGGDAAINELVVVFVGIDPTALYPLSNGVWSRRVTSLRYIPLMEDVQIWLDTQATNKSDESVAAAD